ncbi:MAG TPA: hypothetical protein VFM68_04480 [Candidatus Saccharimonadales bacterium]|nr:hypothetical protein [Candidatus Saccharimonadales bacterium]
MEQLRHDNEELILPTPLQMRKLSRVALATANVANRLKNYDERFEPVYGWVEQYDYDDDEYSKRYERYSGRQARRVFTTIDEQTQREDIAFYADRWSLRYRELKQQHVLNDFWLSELKTYAFEWDNENVLLSLCQTKEVPSVEREEIDRIMALNDEEFDELSNTPTDASTIVVDKEQVGQLTSSIRKRQAAMVKPETRADARRRFVTRRISARQQQSAHRQQLSQ